MTDEERAAFRKKIQERSALNNSKATQVDVQESFDNNAYRTYRIRRRNIMLFIGAGIFFALILFMAFSSSSDKQPNVVSTNKTSNVSEEHVNTEEEMALAEIGLKQSAESAFGENYEVHRPDDESNIWRVDVWQDGTIMSMMASKSSNNIATWTQLKDNANVACKSLMKILDASGLEDSHIMLNLLNDMNNDNVLFTSYDGMTVYDVPFSQVVRLATDGHLEKYLGTVRYIDGDQGEYMKRATALIANELQGIKTALNKLGVNVN